jgi:hypothetical protein
MPKPAAYAPHKSRDELLASPIIPISRLHVPSRDEVMRQHVYKECRADAVTGRPHFVDLPPTRDCELGMDLFRVISSPYKPRKVLRTT